MVVAMGEGMVIRVGIRVDDHGIGTLSMEAGGTFTPPAIHFAIGLTACTGPEVAAIRNIGEVLHRTRMARIPGMTPLSIASSLAPRFATPIDLKACRALTSHAN